MLCYSLLVNLNKVFLMETQSLLRDTCSLLNLKKKKKEREREKKITHNNENNPEHIILLNDGL